MKRIRYSYFIVMVDHGSYGLEAVVHPEDTRRNIIEQIAHGEFENIVFIHHVDDGLIEDVTGELIDAAEALLREVA